MAKPICFMIMPFRTKPTGASPPAPAEVDFDALWERALEPAIKELGYVPVRADQDLGALIINEMIERLALSHLVMADLSIPNGNVYYEVGVRHAAMREGCVLLAADWARPLFDVDQMRQVRYPLADGKVGPVAAEAIKTAVVAGAEKLQTGVSPVFQALPGYPGKHSVDGASAFKTLLDELSAFRADTRAIAEAPKAERSSRAIALRDRVAGKHAMIPYVALELLYVLRDHAGWAVTREYIDSLPGNLRDLVVVREQRSLAQAKLGDAAGAIGVLEELVQTLGDSSERQGLIGGRYKTLYDDALKAGDTDEAANKLDSAIEHYERGMQLDLNDFYPSSNLPRLYRLRGDEGDEALAQRAHIIAHAGCVRTIARTPSNEWVRSTLLGLVFDGGDTREARRLIKEIKREGPAIWKLETTIADLERSLRSRAPDDPFQKQGAELIADLRKLLPPPALAAEAPAAEAPAAEAPAAEAASPRRT